MGMKKAFGTLTVTSQGIEHRCLDMRFELYKILVRYLEYYIQFWSKDAMMLERVQKIYKDLARTTGPEL